MEGEATSRSAQSVFKSGRRVAKSTLTDMMLARQRDCVGGREGRGWRKDGCRDLAADGLSLG